MPPVANPFSSTSFGTGFISKDVKNALTWARRRAILDKSSFDAMSHNNKLHSWTVAGDLTELSVLDIQKKVNSAIEKGVSYTAFTKTLTPEVLEKIVSPRIVFRNAINEVYQKGRFDQQTRLIPLRPFWQYVTFGDDRVRPNHAIMEGIVAKANSGFWSSNYPPNGHACRCTVRALTARQIQRRGLNVRTSGQIQQDAIRAQKKAGVPKNKTVLPLADKGWRGSFAGGDLPVVKLNNAYSKPPTGFLSLITKNPVKLIPRAESIAIKAEPFKAIGTKQDEVIKNVEAKIFSKKTEYASVVDDKGTPFVFKRGIAKPTTIKHGSTTRVSFPASEVTEISKMKNTVLTHNHPLINVSFSDADFVILNKMDLKEIRAVTNKYVFRTGMTPETIRFGFDDRAKFVWNKHFKAVLDRLVKRGFVVRVGKKLAILKKSGRLSNIALVNEFLIHETNIRTAKELKLWYKKELRK